LLFPPHKVFFMFGWAKPVPVGAWKFRNPRRGMAVVAIAGPAMNFFLAWLAALVIPTADALSGTQQVLQQFLLYFMLCNLVLGLFNLLPIPPLDGGRIAVGLLPLQLAKIWEEVLELPRVGIEDHFFDLGGHSLLAVRLVARIEKILGRKIPVAAIFQSPTVAQLAETLRLKKESATTTSIVEIQPKGSKPPLFFVHGVGGGMFWGYTNLSKYLGADQPVFAFKSRGMDGLEEFGTIEEMAAQYVGDLRTFQPHGPYQLGGYCFGGNVAYEMARQLQAQGEKISLLAIIDCAPPNCSYAHFRFTPKSCLKFLINMGYWAGCFRQMNRRQRRDVLIWKIKALKKRVGRLFRPSKIDVEEIVDLAAQPADRRKLWEAHVRALMVHQAKPYAGEVTLFRTRGHPMVCSFDDELGWREFTGGGVIVKMIPGAHESALDEPHVRALAEIVRRHLAEIRLVESKGEK